MHKDVNLEKFNNINRLLKASEGLFSRTQSTPNTEDTIVTSRQYDMMDPVPVFNGNITLKVQAPLRGINNIDKIKGTLTVILNEMPSEYKDLSKFFPNVECDKLVITTDGAIDKPMMKSFESKFIDNDGNVSEGMPKGQSKGYSPSGKAKKGSVSTKYGKTTNWDDDDDIYDEDIDAYLQGHGGSTPKSISPKSGAIAEVDEVNKYESMRLGGGGGYHRNNYTTSGNRITPINEAGLGGNRITPINEAGLGGNRITPINEAGLGGNRITPINEAGLGGNRITPINEAGLGGGSSYGGVSRSSEVDYIDPSIISNRGQMVSLTPNSGIRCKGDILIENSNVRVEGIRNNISLSNNSALLVKSNVKSNLVIAKDSTIIISGAAGTTIKQLRTTNTNIEYKGPATTSSISINS